MRILGKGSLIVFLVSTLLGMSCSSKKLPYNEADQIIESCRDNWYFIELKDSVSVTVILFQEWYPQSLILNPAFIVGVTELGDTVGAIDGTFKGNLKIGDFIMLTPAASPLDDEFQYNNFPVYSVFRKRDDISKICSVSRIFNTSFKVLEE